MKQKRFSQTRASQPSLQSLKANRVIIITLLFFSPFSLGNSLSLYKHSWVNGPPTKYEDYDHHGDHDHDHIMRGPVRNSVYPSSSEEVSDDDCIFHKENYLLWFDGYDDDDHPHELVLKLGSFNF